MVQKFSENDISPILRSDILSEFEIDWRLKSSYNQMRNNYSLKIHLVLAQKTS